MCGVYGFVSAAAQWDQATVRRGLCDLIRLSERRGREAAGIAINLPKEVAVYKRAVRPTRLLESKHFNAFLDRTLAAAVVPEQPIAALGHCRLVTNGSQALEDNNQPVTFGHGLGLHNGIITNSETVGNHVHTTIDTSLDSKLLFELIESATLEAGDVVRGTQQAYSQIEGEASIAMLHTGANSLVLATNTGCLYFCQDPKTKSFVFASEKGILEEFVNKNILFFRNGHPIEQVSPGRGLAVSLEEGVPEPFSLNGHDEQESRLLPFIEPDRRIRDYSNRLEGLRRCSKCILPETFPFIHYDGDGVCNYCHDHVTQVVAGREALLRELKKYRRNDGNPDCIVALSGGRDSSYGLHLLKTELGMTPLAYTYDWGLVTDIARRNQARMCGKLGVEHIIRAADIAQQRRYVRTNIQAWLARPRLGMVPLFMAGDKFFYKHARDLRKETGIDLVVFSAGNELERTPFKSGFAGVRENNYSNRLFALGWGKKFHLAMYYGWQFLTNPRYINGSLLNSFASFWSTFIGKDDFLYLYTYEPWNEQIINDTLITEYDWETAPDSDNTWRIGDGYTSFINYIYYKVAGFTEYDTFRSHQIRDGLIEREEALRLAERDNAPKMPELAAFGRLIGLNIEEALPAIDAIEAIR